MNKIIITLVCLFLVHSTSVGQVSNDKIMFVIDSIQVMEDPEEGNEMLETDVADMIVIKNKDTLKLLGYGQFDVVTFLFTKEYRNRSESVKQIPSSKQMKRKNGVFFLHDSLYSGQFIDYYYSGKKQGAGTFLNGRLNGHCKTYYQNGNLSTERDYKDGIENGYENEFYEDGSLRQKGEFVAGKENGIWDIYFPNGKLKQRSNFNNGVMEGETTVYYSTGKVFATEVTKNGKTSPDPNLVKITQLMTKSNESNKAGDTRAAKKYCSKAIELDSTYAQAYFSRGTINLNDFQFDLAIADFDKALSFEPFMSYALSNRAFARIRKYQFGSSRAISKNSEVTVLAAKDKVPIPKDDQEKICSDLQNAVFLGNRSTMITEAIRDYCATRSGR